MEDAVVGWGIAISALHLVLIHRSAWKRSSASLGEQTVCASSGLDRWQRNVRTYRIVDAEISVEDMARRLSWVEFLDPLSEEELADLLRGAAFLNLERGRALSVGPKEHAEGMLGVVAGQLQVYEVALGSGREHTLWVVGEGVPAGARGHEPRWARELRLRALEPSVVCRIDHRLWCAATPRWG
jgi:hypothetical protein